MRLPVEEEDFDEWLKSDKSLFYPYVSDLPGHKAWDNFACSFLKKASKEIGTDIIVFSEMKSESKEVVNRISFLLKTIGINDVNIMTNNKESETEAYYKKDLDYYLLCSQTGNDINNYKEVNLYVRDYSISENIADYLIEKFSLTTVIHDLYSS